MTLDFAQKQLLKRRLQKMLNSIDESINEIIDYDSQTEDYETMDKMLINIEIDFEYTIKKYQ